MTEMTHVIELVGVKYSSAGIEQTTLRFLGSSDLVISAASGLSNTAFAAATGDLAWIGVDGITLYTKEPDTDLTYGAFYQGIYTHSASGPDHVYLSLATVQGDLILFCLSGGPLLPGGFSDDAALGVFADLAVSLHPEQDLAFHFDGLTTPDAVITTHTGTLKEIEQGVVTTIPTIDPETGSGGTTDPDTETKNPTGGLEGISGSGVTSPTTDPETTEGSTSSGGGDTAGSTTDGGTDGSGGQTTTGGEPDTETDGNTTNGGGSTGPIDPTDGGTDTNTTTDPETTEGASTETGTGNGDGTEGTDGTEGGTGTPTTPAPTTGPTEGTDTTSPGTTDTKNPETTGSQTPQGREIHGTQGDDTLVGTEGDDTIYGYDGHDLIRAGGGNDLVYGHRGNDTLFGEDGDDTVWASDGDDLVQGGSGDDHLGVGHGNDTVNGGAGQDTIVKLSGNGVILGGDDADILVGGYQNDVIQGGAGNDWIRGDVSSLVGGIDWIDGGTGDDVLSGGLSADTFVFRPNEGNDTIADFALTDGSMTALVDMTAGLERGWDRLDHVTLIGFDGVDATNIMSLISQGTDGAILSLEGTTITFFDVDMTDLSIEDFSFV